jgi:hypothetical protein
MKNLDSGITFVEVIRRNGDIHNVLFNTEDIDTLNKVTNSIWVSKDLNVFMNKSTSVAKFLLNSDVYQIKFLNGNSLDCRRNNISTSFNTFIEKEGYVEMLTRKGDKVLIDKEDEMLLKKHTWNVDNGGYVVSNINKKYTQLPRFLLNPPEDKEIDHINRNPLDNRRCNLRICSHEENSRNRNDGRTKKFRGVSKIGKYYVMRIKCDKEKKMEKTFSLELAAASAYNYYAKKFHGEFAMINDCECIENWEQYIRTK